MIQHLLCDEDLKVSVQVDGDCSRLIVENGSIHHLLIDTPELRRAADGIPIQVAAQGAFCRIQRQGNDLRLEFGMKGSTRSWCVIPAVSLTRALDSAEEG